VQNNQAAHLLEDPHFKSLVPEVKVTRRSFITGSVAAGLASGFALSAGPAVAQTAISTSADGGPRTSRSQSKAARCRDTQRCLKSPASARS